MDSIVCIDIKINIIGGPKKNDTNPHGSEEASTLEKNYRQLRSSESGRNSLSHGRAHQLVTQYQIFRTENICIKVISHDETGYIIITHTCKHACMHIRNNS